ncbi:hypothetical protein [Phenylobacterium sp.]|uniref:hypothetical protein n=1 Tax=Phenylobacterium sp. TaxID=1871053 RepID=UPI003563069E
MIGPADWLVVGLWLVAIAFMVIMAWEPWREARGHGSVDLSDGLIGRPVSPGYVFVLPALVAVAPFVAQFVPHAGDENPWRHPHMLSPMGPLALILIVALQAYICRRVLRAVRLHRESLEATRKTLETSPRP